MTSGRAWISPLATYFASLLDIFEVKFAYDPHKSFWQNAQAFHRRVQRKLDARDRFGAMLEIQTLAPERLDPTLADVIMSFALHAKEVPEGFSRYGKLSAFVRDKNNIAFKFSKPSSVSGTVSTNLGRLNFPETYGGLRLERMFFAPQMLPSPLVLGGVGVSGTATFTLNRWEDANREERLHIATLLKVRDRALEYLGFPERISN